MKEVLGELDRDSYVSLLTKIVGEARHVQNNPPDLIPKEDRVARHVLDALLPLSTTTGGGPLIVSHVVYAEGRGNIIVEYPGSVPGKILSFVGCHMDVVTANPTDWVTAFFPYSCSKFRSFFCFPILVPNFDLSYPFFCWVICVQDFDPFSLSVDGDKLRGRGTTDCLGHVALVTELMRRLGQTKLELKNTVVAVFIANEENSSVLGIGVDALVKDGLLDKLKAGPL